MYDKPKTPGLVITAGVLLIVYGSLMLLCGICGGSALFINDPDGEALMVKEVPGYTIVKIGEPVSNLLVGATMIASGIGVLQLMSIARIAAYVVCLYQIVFTIVRNTFTAIFVFPMMERLVAQQAQNQPPMPFDMGQIMKSSMWLGVAIAVLIPLVFCFPILYFLSVKPARDAFAGVLPEEPPQDRPPRYDGYDDDDRPRPPKSPGDTGITDRS
jgi:hypothetical protein